MLAGRRGLSPSLIGRAGALARLQALVDEPPTVGGEPRTALVSGEAGVGKTRLLRELVALVPPVVATLAAGAEPGGLGRPGQLAAELLGEGQPAVDGDRLGALLARIGVGRALVVVEDLHWADSESLLLLERLAAQPRPNLVIVVSYRPDELTRGLPAEEMLRRFVRRHDVHQERLEPLSRPEVSAFLAAVYGRSLPSAVSDALYSRTGGNPFFLEELLTCWHGPAEELASQPLPWTLEEVVSRQLEGLEPEERRVVDAAAVLDRRAGFDALAAMTGLDEDELIDRLRRLVGRSLLVEDDHDRFSFRHALVRDAVEGQLLGRQRRRLHEAALRTLRDLPDADFASLARHAAGADRHEELLALAREGAADYLARGSSFQALRLATDGLVEDPDALDLRSVATQAAWRVGLVDEALGHVQRWLASAPAAADAGERAEALRSAVRLYHELERTDDLWPAMDELAGLVDRVPAGVRRAMALASLAQIHMLRRNVAEAIELATRATSEADAVGGPAADAVAAQAAVEKGSALLMMDDRYEEARSVLGEAIERAEALGQDVLVGRGANNLLSNSLLTLDERRDLNERMHRAVERSGLDGMAYKYHQELAHLAVQAGDQAAATLELERALQHEHLLPPERAYELTRRAMIELEAARTDNARRMLSQAFELSPPGPFPGFSCDEGDWIFRKHMALQVAAMTGDHAAAGPVWEELEDKVPGPYRALVLEDTVATIEAAERLGLAVAEIRAVVLEPVLPWLSVHEHGVVVLDGLLAALAEEHETAIRLLSAGLDASPIGLPRHQAGSLRVRLARAHLAAGRPEAVRPLAEAATADLARWPGWRQQEATALLRRARPAAPRPVGLVSAGDASEAGGSAGGGPSRAPSASTAPALDDLTSREREVVALVAEGLSNGELARRLFISPKTASVHVSNILAKLGMTRRAEIAAWAVRHGVADVNAAS